MSMFNDISCGSRDNKKECESNAQLVPLYAKRFGTGQWSFVGPGSEKKWYLSKAMENCRYTVVPIWKRLKPFSAQLFLQIRSVYTEQSQKCVKKTNP